MTDRTSALGMLTLNDRSDGHCCSRWKILGARLAVFLAVLSAGLAFLPVTVAQTSKPSNAEKTQDTTPALSHDLSGVWMQYPEGDVPGTPGMNAVNQRFRPSLTPWGQARLEAARPLVGPKAIPGEENAPSLRWHPGAP